MDLIENEEIYDLYLESLEDDSNTNILRASGAGNCFLKHLYRKLKLQKAPMTKKERRNLRLGTLVHIDVQKSHRNAGFIDEIPISIPEFNVQGHIDLLKITDKIIIRDIKTIKAFYYSKVFGRRKGEEPLSFKQPMQVMTYMIGIKNIFNIGINNIDAALIYVKKDDSMWRQKSITEYGLKLEELEEKTIKYWENLNNFIEENKLGIKAKKGDTNCPIEKWECKICPYREIC